MNEIFEIYLVAELKTHSKISIVLLWRFSRRKVFPLLILLKYFLVL